MTQWEWENCIREYGKDIYSFCRYLTGNREEADDLYQDTFCRGIALSDRIDSRGNPKSYLLSIAVQLWKNKKRKFSRRKRIEEQRDREEQKAEENGKYSVKETEGKPVEEQIIAKERRELVREAVDRLPERFKVVILLFYMEELSAVQIAQILKIPRGTVLSRLHGARKYLKSELEDILDGSIE